MELTAAKSKDGDFGLKAIPFHWEFEEFCEQNGIRATFYSATGSRRAEYILASTK